MPTKFFHFSIVFLALALLATGCSLPFIGKSKPAENIPAVDNNRNEHGCATADGYFWCEVKQKCLRPWGEACESVPAATSTVIKYLVSKEKTTKYCNGAKMDSVGYKKTITEERSTTTAKINLTAEELAKETVLAATTGMCHTVMQKLDFKINDGVVQIPPIDAWAGVSIVMCSCQPQVEMNLLQIPEVKMVVW